MAQIVDYRSKVVALALSQVGTLGYAYEGDDKYINYYNKIAGTSFSLSTTPWCAIFVTWVLRNSNIPTSVCPNFAGCTYMRDNYLKKKNIWKTRANYTPKAGDLIMFDWDSSGNCDHVGLVETVNGGKVYTIEGNSKGGTKNSGVRHKSYALSSKYIAGYGAIPYDQIDGNANIVNNVTTMDTVATAPTKDKSIIKKYQTWLNTNYGAGIDIDGSYGPKSKRATIKALQTELKAFVPDLAVDGSFGPKTKAACNKVTLSKGNKGNLVYIVQGILYGKGFNPNGFDGSFGAGMRLAVISYQKSKGIINDGIIGTNTWVKLING